MADPRFQNRKFFMHAAHRSVGVSGGFQQRLEDLTGTLAWDSQASSTLRVCLVSPSPLDDSLSMLAALGAWLEESGVAQCEPASWAEGDEASLKNLHSCDRAVFLTDEAALPEVMPAALQEFLASGKPMVVMGRAAHRFLAWLRGEPRGPQGDTGEQSGVIEVTPSPAADGHAILQGVSPFAVQGMFGSPLAPGDGVTVLLHGRRHRQQIPVAWLASGASGSLFATTLGTAADLRIAAFRQLLANAIGGQ